MGTEIARNLATNPSFETAGPAVEVRRNLLKRSLHSGAAWMMNAAITRAVVAGGAEYTASAPVAIASSLVYSDYVVGAEVTAGDTISLGYRVRNTGPAAVPFAVRAFWYIGSATSTVADSTPVSVAPGQEVDITNLGLAVPAGVTSVSLRVIAGVVAGSKFVVYDGNTVEKSSALGPFFSGSTPAAGDFTYRWLGAVNASESVQEGVGVVGVSATGCVAIRSTQWAKSGTYSMRLISTAPNTGSYVVLSNPLAQTAVATVHIEEPSTGVSGPYARALRINGGAVPQDQAPNVAGDYDLRTFNPSSNGVILLGHGGARGTPDIWWDCAGLFEGAYDGPYFDGNTPHGVQVTPTGSRMVQYTWTGTQNASATIMTVTSSVEASSDMVPSPRVRIDLDPADLNPDTDTVTVWQISKWGQQPVRNCDRRPMSGGFVEYDYELPPGVPVTYRVEQFNVAGQSLGLVLPLPARVDIPVGWAVFHDPLAPANAVLLQAELLFAEALKRSRPTAIYQAGDRTLAMSGARSAFQNVVLRCVSMNEAEREKFSEILGETLVLVRTMPQMRLPGSFYAVIPDGVMKPFDARIGGEVDVWDITGDQVSRPTVDIIVAIYTYDRFKAYLDTLHPPTPGTYDDAAALWSTYLDAMRNPPPEV